MLLCRTCRGTVCPAPEARPDPGGAGAARGAGDRAGLWRGGRQHSALDGRAPGRGPPLPGRGGERRAGVCVRRGRAGRAAAAGPGNGGPDGVARVLLARARAALYRTRRPRSSTGSPRPPHPTSTARSPARLSRPTRRSPMHPRVSTIRPTRAAGSARSGSPTPASWKLSWMLTAMPPMPKKRSIDAIHSAHRR